MAATVQITGGELGGLRLIHADDPAFDQPLREIYGDNAGLVADLKPFVVMVVNESPLKIVGCCILTITRHEHGNPGKHPCMYMYPEAAGVNPHMPRGGELLPGEKRVATLDCWNVDPWQEDLDYYLRSFKDMHAHTFAGVVRMEVSLDASIREDGLLLGPDPIGTLKTLYQELLDWPLASLELLRRQSEFTELRIDSITTTNRLRNDHGPKTLLSAMRSTLQNQELTIRRA